MSESPPPGTHKVVTEITDEQCAHATVNLGKPIIDLLNEYSRDHGHMLAVFGGLYAMGCAMANIGANLEDPSTLQESFAPLLMGYDAVMAQKQH